MTEEELSKIPFKFVSHMSMEDEHTIAYQSENGRLGFCIIPRTRMGIRTEDHIAIIGSMGRSIRPRRNSLKP